MNNGITVPEGSKCLSPKVESLLRDAPAYQQKVFVIMRFASSPALEAIFNVPVL